PVTATAARRVLLVAVAVLGVLLLVGRPTGEGPPLDPGSSRPDGTRALVLLLEELGADVEVTDGAPGPDDDVALVLSDGFGDDDATRAEVAAWVEDQGGTLVVADPASALSALGVVGQATGTLTGGCGIPALAGVEVVDPSGGFTYEVPPGARGCFEEGGGAFVVAAGQGRGDVVSIGGAGAFVNGVLGEVDNAVLAGSLLAPRPGTRVALLRPAAPGSGTETLTDLIGDEVWAALAQLGVAFLLYALWRARRLGRPVAEEQPVELPASELVVAVGNLLQRAGRRDQAGRLLAEDARRRLAERLGLVPGADSAEVAEVAAARTGIPVARLLAALRPEPLDDDAALVALAQATETIRREVDHVH
ncbi:MAG: DUF4350 domain-containing protein, partial [Actinomycetota bacterium]|nr:DUF4350 domain-containing protein [Actinomycetota bacterium]